MVINCYPFSCDYNEHSYCKSWFGASTYSVDNRWSELIYVLASLRDIDFSRPHDMMSRVWRYWTLNDN